MGCLVKGRLVMGCLVIGTFRDGMFSEGTFSDGMFSDGMFSNGTFSDGTFCMRTKKTEGRKSLWTVPLNRIQKSHMTPRSMILLEDWLSAVWYPEILTKIENILTHITQAGSNDEKNGGRKSRWTVSVCMLYCLDMEKYQQVLDDILGQEVLEDKLREATHHTPTPSLSSDNLYR